MEYSDVTNYNCNRRGLLSIKGIGQFITQTDQRSDYSKLQQVKGEMGRNRYKTVPLVFT